MQFQLTDVPRILPELMLLLLAILVLGSDILERWGATPEARTQRAQASGSLAAIGLGLIWVITLIQSRFLFVAPAPTGNAVADIFVNFARNLQSGGPGGSPLLGAFATDEITALARLIFVGAALLVALLAYGSPALSDPGEFFTLLILATLGMNVMAASTELILAYIALELSSVSLYVMAGYFRANPQSSEAGLKYFLFGVLSSAILLYGMSLVYGYTAFTMGQSGSAFFTQFGTIADAFRTGQMAGDQQSGLLLTLGMVFIIAGLGYKVAVVPFHSWSPDVYQGAPTIVTAFLSTASKAAGFFLLYRVLVEAFPGMIGTPVIGGETPFGGWASLLAIIALLTVLFGNLAALPQTNAKRLLAYSSIGHAGFVLLALIAWAAPLSIDQAAATSALIYYLVTYTATNIGAFGVLAVVAHAVGGDDLRDLNGLAQRNLGLATLLAVFVLSLAGIPPLAGFLAKFYVFLAGYQAGALWLVIVAILTTVISLFYYLRFLRAMFMEPPAAEGPLPVSAPVRATLVVAALLVFALGLLPGPLLALFQRATTLALGG